MAKPLRVLIVDDSAVVRQVIKEILEKESDIEVMAAASDPVFAQHHMAKEWPDVITLDVEMPRMDGITFLKKIMATRPTPVVICSSLTTKNAETTMDALHAGAVSVITKPTLGVKNFLLESSDDLVSAVRAAGKAKIRPAKIAGGPATKTAISAPDTAHASAVNSQAMVQTTERIIAIGASTGGTQAIEQILRALPRTAPGIIIVQHMPEMFTAAFAARLNQVCEMEVCEAKNGQRVLPGQVLISPGGKHMQLRRNGAQYVVEIKDGPPVNRHKPSVDVLFRSVAQYAGKNAKGILLTGMGDDGARGLKEMRDAGGMTYAQDEASCIVFGMPKEAIKLGAAGKVVPLEEVAGVIMH